MSFSFAGYCFDKYKKFLNHEYKDYSFNIDLKFGKIYFTRKLFTLPGKYLPFDLTLKYIEPHTASGQFLHLKTGLPIGIKTNYHVFLEYNNTCEKYWLEDSDGFLHVFKLADNSTTLYFDKKGSGLMMEILSGGYKVFDDYGNYQLFDSNGRLTLIHQQIANSHTAELTITYISTDPVDSLRIYSITDNYGKVVYFSYTSSGVQISYNNNVVVTISYDNDMYLTEITKNIGDNHIITESFNCDPLLHEIALDDGNYFTFYYYDDKISGLSSSINHCRYAFDYFYNQYKVNVIDSGGVKTKYDFDQEQPFNEYSCGSEDLSYLTLSSEHLSCLVKEANDDEVLNFILDDSGQEPSYIYDMPYNEPTYQTPDSSNNNLLSKKAYLFCAKIQSTMAVGDHFTVELKDADSNLLARLIFKKGSTFLAAPVGIKESTQRQFYLTFSKDYSNSALILEAKLVPLIGSFGMLCSNISTDEPIFFYGDTPYYLLSSGKGVFINSSSTLSGYRLFMNDYLANERLLYISGTSTHYWFDDLRGLADDVSSMQIKMTSYMNMAWLSNPKSIKHSYMYPAPDALFYRVSGKDDCSLKVSKISHNGASFPAGHTSYHYEEEITEYLAVTSGHTSIYDYDSNYLLQKVTYSDGTIKEYSYDSNGNLLENEISNGTNTDTISEQFTYDSSDNVTSESKLVGSAVSTATYDYDSAGKHTDTHYPNLLTETHFYDSITEERETGVRFKISAAIYINQNNNYLAEDSYSLSTGGNTHLINSYSGEVCEIKYNGDQTLEIEYVPNIHQDIVMNYRYYYRYANGYEYYDQYDNFRRIISNNGVIYGYDDFNNVTSIIDPFVQQVNPNFNPNISYEYDYFNQLVATDVYYNGLSSTYTYDKYHRLNSQSNTEYSIIYSYYSLRYLEKKVKQSLISRDSFTALVNDEIDTFSRLIERSIAYENVGFKIGIEYYHSSVDTNRTNNYINEVSYYNNNNNTYAIYRTDFYTYNSNGNIETINTIIGNNNYLIKYHYDKYSRLVLEINKFFNRTYAYEYDSNGNLTSKTEYPYTELRPDPADAIATHTYSYDSAKPNRLMVYDNERFLYDAFGNPIVYRDHPITWARGSLLNSILLSNGKLVSFKYDGFKNRIFKTRGNVSIFYKYLDGNLISETRNDLSNPIIYIYSHAGIIGFSYDTDIYFYEKNVQQDVIAIRNSNNQVIAKYIYDAWGNHKVLTSSDVVDTNPNSIGNLNPFRYRSYYYDTDLKMYWLTSRYYDPEIGRFISPDSWDYLDYKKLHSLNLYAYSRNDPVMYFDPSGHSATAVIVLLAVILIAFAATLTVFDLISLESGNVKADNSTDGNIQINNSCMIVTPWVKVYYLWYLKYVEERNINGSLFGALFEWECHNLAIGLFSILSVYTKVKYTEEMKRAQNVDLGSTIFSDNTKEWYGPGMKIAYCITCSLLCRLDLVFWDLLVFLGFGGD